MTPFSSSIAGVLAEVGATRFHILAGRAAEPHVLELLRDDPSRIASLTLVAPVQAGPELELLSGSLTAVCESPPSMNPAADLARREIETIGDIIDLPDGYAIAAGVDIAADNPDLVLQGVRRSSEAGCGVSLRLPRNESMQGDLRIRTGGQGEPLLILPLALTPSQWASVLPTLQEEYATILVSGVSLGALGFLEERAERFQGMVSDLFDRLDVAASDQIVEVGAGSGVLSRQLAHRLGSGAPITALDFNEFFVEEARAAARRDPRSAEIDFRFGDATSLPLEDSSIDVAFSVTVFEECDVDAALAELHRVLRPGGRAGVIVRSIDVAHYWNLELPPEVSQLVNAPLSPGGVAPLGCADRSLHERMSRKFGNVSPYIYWSTYHPPMPIFINSVRSRLSKRAAVEFEEALERASNGGTAFHAVPFHGAVATKH